QLDGAPVAEGDERGAGGEPLDLFDLPHLDLELDAVALAVEEFPAGRLVVVPPDRALELLAVAGGDGAVEEARAGEVAEVEGVGSGAKRGGLEVVPVDADLA